MQDIDCMILSVNGGQKRDQMYNSLIILAKQFIHKCRFLKVRPLFCVFMDELRIYKKSLKCIKNKQAGMCYR